MKFKISLLFLFLSFFQLQEVFGRTTPPQYFLIKGKVKNAKEKTLSFALTTFFNNKIITIPIRRDGSFSQKVDVDGMQDVYLYLNDDALTFYVQPEDSIEINWDKNNFEKSFEIKSFNNSRRDKRNVDLQLNLKLYQLFRKSELALHERLYKEREMPDSARHSWINELYNKELAVILEDTVTFYPTRQEFVHQTYYKYSNLLFHNNLLPKFTLIIKESIANPHNSQFIRNSLPKDNLYKIEYEDFLNQSSQYRDFIFNVIRFPNPIISFHQSNGLDLEKTSQPWNEYYQAIISLKVRPVREWFITKSIIMSFEHYSFRESEEVMNEFLSTCKTEKYKETLTSFYNSFKHLQPGNKAPDFTLKNEKGNTVSLTDFKGKVVYIDFWGVGCAPCVYDIKNFVPQLHKRYHDKEVVFINICVDANEKNWKNFISVNKLDGINLLAEGWLNNETCNKYKINGIPHYYIIDKEGNIFEPNAARPYELVPDKNNMIDKLLEKKI